MRARVTAAVALGVVTTIGLVEPASASTRASTTVTIEAESGGFFGYVSSSKPALCADGRRIILYRQVGDVQNPSVDLRIATDNAEFDGTGYRWSTGNTGSRRGRFYARARTTLDCRPDTSPTIRAQQ